MLCEAEKIAAEVPSHLNSDDNSAISIKTTWDAVKHLAGVEVPVRRPKRCRPSREAEQQYVDVELARQAMADSSGIMPYDEFRKELGLSD